MAIASGLAEQFFVDANDLSAATAGARRLSSSMSPLQTPVISERGMRRIPGLRDGAMDVDSWFDDSVIHPVLSTLPTVDRVATWCLTTALGGPTASIVGKQIGYDPTRGQDGSLALATSVLGNGSALEWGRSLTGGGAFGNLAVQGSAGSLTGYNDEAIAATNFGLQLYVHLLSFTGTSITIAVHDSNDNGAGDAYAIVPGATTAALTTPGAVRVTTSATENVKEWLRITTTGTFSAATFVAAYVRNATARWF
jgi:hypothetical protein